jgi:hypothetical protein
MSPPDDVKPDNVELPGSPPQDPQLTAAVSEPPSGRIPISLAPLRGQAPKRQLSETTEKIVYFLALMAGSAFILIGKVAGWLPPVPGAVAATTFIVVYFFFAYLAMRENKVRADRMGDNCYYLGLVYTLASLIATLIQIDQGADIQRLLGNFGVALVSTAAGIIGRLILIQFRSETDDVDQRARLAISEAADQLKTDLLGAVSIFQTLLIGAQESFRASIEHTKANYEEARQLTEKMKGLEVSPQTLNDTLTATVDQLRAAGAGLAEAGREIREQASAVTSTVQAAERSELGLRKIDAVLADLAKTLERQRDATIKTVEALELQQNQVTKYRTSMEADAEKAREAVERVYTALGDLANTIVKRVQ